MITMTCEQYARFFAALDAMWRRGEDVSMYRTYAWTRNISPQSWAKTSEKMGKLARFLEQKKLRAESDARLALFLGR